MSNSRRKFLKAGMLAALFATVPLKNALGRSWKDQYSNPTDNQSGQDDPLANYTKATFKSYLNSIFQLLTFTGIVEVTLLQVDDLPAAKGGECFSLLFRGGGRALQQDTYTLVHPALGTFQLMLVPAGSDNNGAQGYLATINRLSYSDAQAPGEKLEKRGWMEDSTAPTNASPTTTPATPPKIRKPAKKIRKPSWKSNDHDDFYIE